MEVNKRRVNGGRVGGHDCSPQSALIVMTI